MDPENRKGVCGTTDILSLRSCKPTLEMSTSSIVTPPLPPERRNQRGDGDGRVGASESQSRSR